MIALAVARELNPCAESLLLLLVLLEGEAGQYVTASDSLTAGDSGIANRLNVSLLPLHVLDGDRDPSDLHRRKTPESDGLEQAESWLREARERSSLSGGESGGDLTVDAARRLQALSLHTLAIAMDTGSTKDGPRISTMRHPLQDHSCPGCRPRKKAMAREMSASMPQ